MKPSMFLSGIGAPGVKRPGLSTGGGSRQQKFQFADLSSSSNEDEKHKSEQNDLAELIESQQELVDDLLKLQKDTLDLKQISLGEEIKPEFNPTQEKDSLILQDSIENATNESFSQNSQSRSNLKIKSSSILDLNLNQSESKLSNRQNMAPEQLFQGNQIEFQQFSEVNYYNESPEGGSRTTLRSLRGPQRLSATSDQMYERTETLAQISPNCADSLNSSGKNKNKSFSEDSSAKAARLRLQDQYARQMSDVDQPNKPSIQDDSFNSRASEGQEEEAKLMVINQPIQFYEVDDDGQVAEDQQVENKAWTDSFEGQLFSIAEQTSLREQTLIGSNDNRSSPLGVGSQYQKKQLIGDINNYADVLMSSGGIQRRKWTINSGNGDSRRENSTHEAKQLFGSFTGNSETMVRPQDIVQKLRTTQSSAHRDPIIDIPQDRLLNLLHQEDQIKMNQAFEITSEENLLASNHRDSNPRDSNHLNDNWYCGSLGQPGTNLLEADNEILLDPSYLKKLANKSMNSQLKSTGKHSKSVGIQVGPQQTDQQSQTYGPRKTSYYKEIPAKIKSRPQSHSRNKSDSEKGFGPLETQKSSHNDSKLPEDFIFSPNDGSIRKQNISLSPSKSNKLISPSLGQKIAKNPEEAKYLRHQLSQAREQYRDSSTENLLLSERVKALENILQQKDKVINTLQCDMAQLHSNNCRLKADIDLQSRQYDSLLADKAESAQITTGPPIMIKQQILSDAYTQTDDFSWLEYVQTQFQEQNHVVFSPRSNPVSSNRSRIPQLNTTPIILENFSREEQGYPEDYTHSHTIRELQNRASDYENEYRKLEIEIADYKLQLQLAVKQQHYEQGHISLSNEQNHNRLNFHTGVGGDVNDRKYKLRAKKLEKRLQKITLSDMQNQNTIVQLDRLLKDHYEKYRDMKQKLEQRVNERDVQISELRQSVQFYQFQMVQGRPNQVQQQHNSAGQPDIISFVNTIVDQKIAEQSRQAKSQNLQTSSIARSVQPPGIQQPTNSRNMDLRKPDNILSQSKTLGSRNRKKQLSFQDQQVQEEDQPTGQMTFQQNSVYTDSIDGKAVVITSGLVRDFMQQSEMNSSKAASQQSQAESNAQKLFDLRMKYGVNI